MNYNKLPHVIMGSVLYAVGFAGLLLQVGGGFGKAVSWLLIGVGGIQAIIVGHLPIYLIMLLAAPFWILGYFFFIPIKKKKGKVVDEAGSPVIARHRRKDRIVLVREFDILNSIEGTSVFRDQKKLQKMEDFLKINGVPEYSLDEKRVRQAVDLWNKDEELLQRAGRSPRLEWKANQPTALIHLNKDDEESVDRIGEVIELLWGSKQYRSRQLEDIIQLAIWYSLAVDVCYGREDQSWLDRIFV